ncbi:hypothetical protein EYC84_003265 [Monilinia fructicola]|uniref:Uncharacterized protein n=1 Tax=Monilinia fructicola TaxID=38448 RepID=A0A5M9JTZ1_MONFR|nr:hypothetical protein EYC84_003265 [Monilinia fructicola]
MNPWEKGHTTKAANTIEEKAPATAKRIESLSLNKPPTDVNDTVCHEHRFQTTYYVLVSSVSFIDDYDAPGASYKSLEINNWT